ncbi:MAG: heavy metal-binding domain-containing protein [Myxococcota bacterium]
MHPVPLLFALGTSLACSNTHAPESATASHHDGTPARPAPTPAPSADPIAAPAKSEAAAYACPMHPEVTADAPGTCPSCGMALVVSTKH